MKSWTQLDWEKKKVLTVAYLNTYIYTVIYVLTL